MTSEQDKGNTNCLSGLQCPNCSSLEPFAIEVVTTFRVYDDGLDERLDGSEWDESSYCECCKCAHAGIVKDFTLAQEKAA